MGQLRWVELTDGEVDEFLGRGGTGVISFSTGGTEPPASIPVSYGYAATDRALYFNLSFPPGSRKEELTDTPVTFVSHAETGDGWRSVVARGRLHPVADAPYESTAVQGMWEIDIPAVDIFDQPRDEIEFQHYRLDPERLAGRRGVTIDE